MEDTLYYSLVRGAESADLANGNPQAARWVEDPRAKGELSGVAP